MSYDQKRFATLQALGALAGITLVPSTNDAEAEVFIVTRGALVRELPTLDQVEEWLAQAGDKARAGGIADTPLIGGAA